MSGGRRIFLGVLIACVGGARIPAGPVAAPKVSFNAAVPQPPGSANAFSVISANVNPAVQAGAAPAAPARVIVKLKSQPAQSMAQAMSATPEGSVNLPAAAGADQALAALLVRHNVRAAKPLVAREVQSKLKQGRSAEQLRAALQQRFPRREARAPANARLPDFSGTYVFDLGNRSRAEVAATVQSLLADPNVLYAAEDKQVHATYVPNDPSYASSGSWGQAYDDLHGLKRIGTTAAWDVTQGEGVLVAVVDTGVDYNHPDISANIWTNTAEIPGNGIDDDHNGFVDDVHGWDFTGSSAATPIEDNDPYDGHFHGTHVAGTIAATGDNGLGVVGVAWKAKIMPVKGLDDNGMGYDSALARAIIYATDNGADVINASWGGTGSSPAVAEALQYAHAHGVVIVVAAGNNAIDAENFYPANSPDVITVSALNPDDTLANFSNFGAKIDVAAPGVDILSLKNGTSDYFRLNGTSMAAPHVAGVAALILAQHPAYSNEQVRQAIRMTATDLGPPGRDNSFGYGRVNAAQAVLFNHALEARIFSPTLGTPIAGPIAISVSAGGTDFDHYVLDYGAGTEPTSWTTLRADTVPVTNANIATFDPSALADGAYAVRLRVFDAGGTVFEDRTRIEVRYLAITTPLPTAIPSLTLVAKPGAAIQINGSARGPSFQHYLLEWAPGRYATTGWSSAGMQVSGSGASTVVEGSLGSWTPSTDLSGYYTIRLSVANDGFVSTATTMVYLEPDLLSSGWPKLIPSYHNQSPVPVHRADGTTRLVICGTYSPILYLLGPDGVTNTVSLDYGSGVSPAVGDLDGQPGDEIVVADGRVLKIFSADLTLIRTIPLGTDWWSGLYPVMLADLDNDHRPEIIVPVTNTAAPGFVGEVGEVRAYRFDGTPFFASAPPFHTDMTNWFFDVKVVAVDLNRDGHKEIVTAFDNHDGGSYQIAAYNTDGTPFADWAPLTISGRRVRSLEAADLDRDGTCELVVTDNNPAVLQESRVAVYDHNGEIRPGWPVAISSHTSVLGTAIGDLDQDQQREIVVTSGDSIAVLRADGTFWREPWIISDSTAYTSVPLIADIDGDGHPDIIVATHTIEVDPVISLYYAGKLLAYHTDGTNFRSWTLFGQDGRQPFRSTPLVGDFNGDGKTDIAVNVSVSDGGQIGGWLNNTSLVCFTTGTPLNASATSWPTVFGDPQNTRALVDPPPVITAQPSSVAVRVGNTASFSVTTTGGGPFRYQWQRRAAGGSSWTDLNDGGAYSGAATATLSVGSPTLAMDGDAFRCVITNSFGTVTSSPAVLGSMNLPGATIVGAQRRLVQPGQALDLGVTASGGGTYTYQWTRNGLPIPGANQATLSIPSASRADAGYYLATVTNEMGSVRSAPMFVLVAPAHTQVLAWGDNFQGQSTVPAGLTDVIALDGNNDSSLVARQNGSLAGWGYPDHYLPFPASASGFVAIASGGVHNLAITGSGAVVGWGGSTTVPAGITDAVAVAVGYARSYVLKADGTVVTWDVFSGNNLQTVAGLQNVVAISAGLYSVLALRSDGTVVSAGGGAYWDGTAPAGLTNVQAIAVSDDHALALKTDGTVVAWGDNANGETVVPAGLTGVVAIAAAQNFSLALKADGTVVSWGNLGTAPATLDHVWSIATGTRHALVLRDTSADTAPVIATPPAGLTRAETATATFTVGVTGAGPFSYQWRRNGTPLSGETKATLTLTNLTMSQAGDYDVVVTNHIGSTTSAAATLVMKTIPVVTLSSQSRYVLTPGTQAALSVSATGTGALSYQWVRNGHLIPGANTNSYQATAAGWYVALVTDDNGTRRSAPMFVLVAPAITQIRAWGAGTPVETALPVTMADAVAISSSINHALALKRDGTVVAWGNNQVGQASVPPDLTGVVQIVADEYVSFALKSDGTVVAWGGGIVNAQLAIPAGLSDVVSIDVEDNQVLALKSDGTVVGWGYDSYGMLPLPADLANITAVALARTFAMALKEDGSLVSWGGGATFNPPDSSLRFTAIAGGILHGVGLKTDGTVAAWGAVVGTGETVVPSGLANVTGIEARYSRSAAIRSDGSIVLWGFKNPAEPDIPADVNKVQQVRMDVGYVMVLRDGTSDTVPVITTQPASQVRAENGTVTFSVGINQLAPAAYQWRRNGVNLAGQTGATLTLTNLPLNAAGDYDVIVSNHIGSVTSSAATLTVNPLPVVTNTSAGRQLVRPGRPFTISADISGTGAVSVQWYRNGRPIPGATGFTLQVGAATAADAGYYYLRATDGIGTRQSQATFVTVMAPYTAVRAWGSNSDGQTNVPVNLTDAVAVAAGSSHTLALKADGTLVTWGWDNSVPPIPTNPDGFVAIAAGVYFNLALKPDGTLVKWGSGTNLPAGLNNIVAIAAGAGVCYALRADGTVTGWQSSSNAAISMPAGLQNVVGISAAYNYAVAVKADGTVVSWETAGGTEIFNVASGLANIVSATPGAALRADGTVVAWGNSTPGAVPAGLAGVRAISGNYVHVLALKADGTVTGWGNNSFGQLTMPADLTNVRAVAAGMRHSVALLEIPVTPPVITTPPDSQIMTLGSTVQLKVQASSPVALTYQWRKDGSILANGGNISGADTATLVIANAQDTDTGTYNVVVTNGAGSASATAKLTISLPGERIMIWRNQVTGNVGFWLMNGTTARAYLDIGSIPLDWQIAGTGDFNHDGQTDLLWRNRTTGNVGFWLMNGSVAQTYLDIGPIPLEWQIAGTGDFNHDGNTDIIWRNQVNGNVGFWIMNGTTAQSYIDIGPIPLDWQIAGTGDFNHDGNTDLLWRHRVGGNLGFWMMNGTTAQSYIDVGYIPLEWQISGTADLNNDGNTDIIWRQTVGGNVGYWFMNGTTAQSYLDIGPIPLEWQIMR